MESVKRLLPSFVPEVCEENEQIAEECRLTLALRASISVSRFPLVTAMNFQMQNKLRQRRLRRLARNFSPLP